MRGDAVRHEVCERCGEERKCMGVNPSSLGSSPELFSQEALVADTAPECVQLCSRHTNLPFRSGHSSGPRRFVVPELECLF